jgi:hypothetical protein
MIIANILTKNFSIVIIYAFVNALKIVLKMVVYIILLYYISSININRKILHGIWWQTLKN